MENQEQQNNNVWAFIQGLEQHQQGLYRDVADVHSRLQELRIENNVNTSRLESLIERITTRRTDDYQTPGRSGDNIYIAQTAREQRYEEDRRSTIFDRGSPTTRRTEAVAETDGVRTIRTVDPIREEDMLQDLTPYGYLKLIEKAEDFDNRNGVHTKLAKFLPLRTVSKILEKLHASQLAEFKHVQRDYVTAADDDLMKKLISVATRPIGEVEYGVLWANNLNKPNIKAESWEFGQNGYDEFMYPEIVKFIKMARGILGLVHCDVPERVSKSWPKPTWGTKENIGIIRLISSRLGKYEQNYKALMGGEDFLKTLGKQDDNGPEKYLDELERTNDKMCATAKEYRNIQASYKKKPTMEQIEELSREQRRKSALKNYSRRKNTATAQEIYELEDELLELSTTQEEIAELHDVQGNRGNYSILKRPQSTAPTNMSAPRVKTQSKTENPGPCFAELRPGGCTTAGCKYSHNERDIKDMMRAKLRDMATSKYGSIEILSYLLEDLKAEQRKAGTNTLLPTKSTGDSRLRAIEGQEVIEEEELETTDHSFPN